MKKTTSIIIKSIMVLFIAVYLILLFRTDYAKDIPMDQIASVMESETSIAELEQQGRARLRRFYQLDGDETDGFFFYKAVSTMAVEEAFIVKARDKAQADACLAAAQARLSAQKGIFEGYGTDQMALLNNAAVGSRGNYVFYFCGAEAASWQQTFLSLI